LIEKAKKKGLYENFGQREVGELMEKYDLHYNPDADQRVFNLLIKFGQWCRDFDDSDLRGL